MIEFQEDVDELELQSKKGIVYCILNKITGLRYIGKTKNSFWKRYSNGKWWNNTGNSALREDIEIYGKNAFHVYVLECGLSDQDVIKMEGEYIRGLNTVHPNGYNLTFRDGNGRQKKAPLAIKNILSGKVKKAEDLLRQGIVKKRKPKTPEECLAISERTRGDKNPRFGVVMSEETKEKIRMKATGRTHSLETKLKLKGRIGEKAVAARHVLQIDPLTQEVLKEFFSIRLAAQALNIRAGNISCACSGFQKTAAGFIWKYKNPSNKPKIHRPSKTQKRILQLSLDGAILNEFSCARTAALHVQRGETSIRSACKGIQDTSGGYKWAYKDSYQNETT